MGYLQMTRNVESIFGAVVTAPHQIPYTYTATGGETFISLPFYPVTGFITINSGVQVPVDNYVIDGNTVNLGRALEAGDVVYCLFDKILSPEDYENGIRIYKFQAVGNETTFTPDFTTYGVQSLYVDGKFRVPDVDYTYSPTDGAVNFLTGSPAAGVWVVAEMSIKQNYLALSSNNGASLIGTASGNTVQEEINTLKQASGNFSGALDPILSRLAAESGLPMVGTFEAGATITTASQSVGYKAEGKLYTWAGTLPKTVAAGSTPATAGGIAADAWVRVDQNSLRSQLASTTGSNLVGYKNTSVTERLNKTVFITDFGGGEAVTDNLAAFNLAKAAAGNGGTVTFPKQAAGIYNFSAFPDMTGIVINPDAGVVFRGPASNNAVNPAIVTTRDYRVYFNAGDPKDYYIDMRANVHAGSKGANKSLWLNDYDISNRTPDAVNANNILVKQIALGVGDTFANATPAGRSASSLFLQPPTGGTTQLGVIPAVPGTELNVAVNNIPTNSGEIAIGMLFSSGYAVVRGYPSSGSWSLSVKYIGSTSTDQVLIPDGGNTATYSASNNLITVRCISMVRAQVLINGVVLSDFQVASGNIQWLGVGATSISAVSSSNFTGWYTRQFRAASSPRSQVLGVIGDSISDAAIDGSWPVWAAEALDSSFGIRINGIENRAVSGQTLDQQIANLATNPFVNASIVAVFIGTNDIQGGNTLAAFQASMNTLLNTLQSQGRNAMLVIPPQWYLKTDNTTGGGGATTNSNKGGDIRAAIGRIAADRGLQLVDLTEATGPMNPEYLTSTFADPIIRDNMHPTAYAYRFYGYEIAKAIASQLCPVVKAYSDWVNLPGAVAGLTNTLQYRFVKEGIQFRGRLEGSSALNGLVLTLPEFLRQSSIRYYIAWGNTGPVPVYFNTDGTVLVHNNASSTQLSFDGVVLTSN